MKILVFSDSHSDVETMAKTAAAEAPDITVHLGDCAADARELERMTGCRVISVRGNTDGYDAGVPEEEVLMLEKKKLLLSHGHIYDVKASLSGLRTRAADALCDVALFGHTHRPHAEYSGRTWLVNPGRIGKRSSRVIRATYAVITIRGGKLDICIKDA